MLTEYSKGGIIIRLPTHTVRTGF